MIASLYYPFKIIQFMAHNEYFGPVASMINTFMRTVPGMSIFIFINIIMYASLGMGFHMALSQDFKEFATYYSTIYNMI